MTVRVLLVDDEHLVRSGLRMILSGEPDIEVVGEAGDGEAAVVAVGSVRPDVVLMDLRMPRMDGLEAIRRIVAASATPPRILVLTLFDPDESVYAAIRAGASGFLLKDAPEERLVAAIRVVADGGSLFDPAVTRRLIERFSAAFPPASAEAALAGLTAREREILGLLARGRSNAEIAAELVITEHTVKTHVAHVLDKLDLRDRVGAVVLAYETGLVRPTEST